MHHGDTEREIFQLAVKETMQVLESGTPRETSENNCNPNSCEFHERPVIVLKSILLSASVVSTHLQFRFGTMATRHGRVSWAKVIASLTSSSVKVRATRDSKGKSW